MPDATTVDFYFDPGCPWTWTTSRWLVQAAEERNFTIVAHPFALKIKNEGAPPNPYTNVMDVSMRALRVFVAIERAHGNAKALEFYSEYGYRYFPADLDSVGPNLTEVLTTIGVDPSLADAANEDSYDGAIAESLQEALRLAKDGAGSPVVAKKSTDRGFFGPVITDLPTSEHVGKLWDYVEGALDIPEFYELKRDRSTNPVAPPAGNS